MGDTIVDKLRTNKQIGWKFVNDNEANLGVADGTYFAVIEIPGNFSESFGSVLTDGTKKPEIIYKVDTKDNPVASKITEAAKKSLVDQISSNFISTVNETLFTSFNKVGEDAEINKNRIIQWKDEVIQANRNMDALLSMLQDINSRSSNLSSFLIEIKATMPAVDSELSTISQVNDNNANLIKTTQLTLNQSFANIETDLNNAQASVNVFLRDLKSIFKSKAAVLIIAGLCILPSLYAWINIQASWNPYANTGNLPIAVTNNDEGAVFNGKEINVGNQIVEELKNSKSINWIIIDSWQGNYGLNQGKYYALIEIPNNFSKSLASLTTVTPNKPDIIYKVNEKLNAIASKITNAATLQLADNVKSNFVATVTREALNKIQWGEICRLIRQRFFR